VIVAQATPAAPRASTAWLVRLRGLLAVPLAGALVLGAPGLAYATFTARTTAAVSVGTYKIPAPASISGNLECTRTGKGATITITDFGLVDRATKYTATLTLAGGEPLVVPVTADKDVPVTNFGGKGKYTFTLIASVGSWTGTPLERTVIC
jgi:hypothetical protein